MQLPDVAADGRADVAEEDLADAWACPGRMMRAGRAAGRRFRARKKRMNGSASGTWYLASVGAGDDAARLEAATSVASSAEAGSASWLRYSSTSPRATLASRLRVRPWPNSAAWDGDERTGEPCISRSSTSEEPESTITTSNGNPGLAGRRLSSTGRSAGPGGRVGIRTEASGSSHGDLARRGTAPGRRRPANSGKRR